MYKSIGSTIKSYVKLLYVIATAIASLICIQAFITFLENGKLIPLIISLSCVVLMICFWISTWLLYAFGELADKAMKVDNKINIIDEKLQFLANNNEVFEEK